MVLTVEQLAGRLRTGRAGILSLLVVMAMPLVDMVLCRLLMRPGRSAQPGGESPSGTTFRPVLRRGVHIGGHRRERPGDRPPLEPRSGGPGGPRCRGAVAGALVDIGLTLMLAYLVWQLAKTAIDQRLEREVAAPGRE